MIRHYRPVPTGGKGRNLEPSPQEIRYYLNQRPVMVHYDTHLAVLPTLICATRAPNVVLAYNQTNLCRTVLPIQRRAVPTFSRCTLTRNSPENSATL
jgi:hypothetical protein